MFYVKRSGKAGRLVYAKFFTPSVQLTHQQSVSGRKTGLAADLAFINANVITMNPAQPKAEAVAVKEGRIIKVGTNQQIKQLTGKNTEIRDLLGKTVVPGLIDTHIHVADFGRCLMWLDLTTANSIIELKQMLKQRVQQTQAGKWIIGQGWNENRLKRMPTTRDLDVAAPDNPVILYREAAMICSTNTKAQKLAGVTDLTPAPPGGNIDKDPRTGKLAGIFRDAAASLIWQAVPEPTDEDLTEATQLALQKIVEAGLTSIHWLVLSPVELNIIQNLHSQNKLPVRVNVVVPENLIEKAKKLQTSDPAMLRFGGVTITVDGYLDSKEAALIEPYSDDPNNTGKLLCGGEALAASVRRVLAAGVQPIIVVMGDRAIDEALKVIEDTSQVGIRFRIEQAAVLNENLLQRLKKQDVVVSIQPKMVSTEFTVWSAQQRLGERACWLHPLKSLVDAGVKVAGGSDCPMEPLNPFLGIQESVFRQAYPEQRVSVVDALRMYTLDAAYSTCEEGAKGSIEEGKLADLTILASNPEVVAPDKFKDIRVNTVVVGGKILRDALSHNIIS